MNTYYINSKITTLYAFRFVSVHTSACINLSISIHDMVVVNLTECLLLIQVYIGVFVIIYTGLLLFNRSYYVCTSSSCNMI